MLLFSNNKEKENKREERETERGSYSKRGLLIQVSLACFPSDTITSEANEGQRQAWNS